MSKPTSYNVSPSEFELFFEFTPCNCHEYPSSVSSARYTVEYETEPYSSIVKYVEVKCNSCGRTQRKRVYGVDGSKLPF